MFSYGFLEEGVSSARELFLDLQIPNDDPLALAKKRVSTSAPGIKIYEDGDEVQWYSDFLYLVCVNEEDGLDFRLLQTNDGDREIQAQWKGSDLHDPSKLQEVLQKDTMWEVFQLRAIALVQQRVEEQLQLLVDTTDVVILETGNDRPVRDGPRHLATQLRKLERTLLEKAFKNLEHEKLALFETEIVRDYLSAQAGEAAEQDFT
ncbi:hypothetical protein EJ08DRAFT_652230 [Tothia fuscella]|uniref:Uncharacterized protein n=1 Tax=Tothia fuscella TaxID=1048955 RepID=A0A9P4TVR5_9PEZI|nr:hypothetical protein EJ08DRAFT_652230 [Tothia fuscella]